MSSATFEAPSPPLGYRLGAHHRIGLPRSLRRLDRLARGSACVAVGQHAGVVAFQGLAHKLDAQDLSNLIFKRAVNEVSSRLVDHLLRDIRLQAAT